MVVIIRVAFLSLIFKVKKKITKMSRSQDSKVSSLIISEGLVVWAIQPLIGSSASRIKEFQVFSEFSA